MRFSPKPSNKATNTKTVVRPNFSMSLIPCSTRSILFAPTFCPTKVEMAIPKVKLGSMANPSIRITAVLHVTIRYPILLARACTNTADIEKMALVIPAGNPNLSSWLSKFLVRLQV